MKSVYKISCNTTIFFIWFGLIFSFASKMMLLTKFFLINRAKIINQFYYYMLNYCVILGKQENLAFEFRKRR